MTTEGEATTKLEANISIITQMRAINSIILLLMFGIPISILVMPMLPRLNIPHCSFSTLMMLFLALLIIFTITARTVPVVLVFGIPGTFK